GEWAYQYLQQAWVNMGDGFFLRHGGSLNNNSPLSVRSENAACNVKKLFYYPNPCLGGRSSGVEHNLAKVGVEGSNPFARSKQKKGKPCASPFSVWMGGEDTGALVRQ